MRSTYGSWWLLFALPALYFGVDSAQAQNYDNPGLGELPVTAHPQDYKPLGIRAGGFMLHPGAHLTAEFTDNVFFVDEEGAEGTRSDTAYHLRPYITAQSNWSRHGFNLRLAADIARFDSYAVRDYEDYFLLISGRVDVRSRSRIDYSLDYMDLHEDLSSRSSEQGLEPTRYNLYGGSLGYDHTFNRLSVGVQASLRTLDFDNAIARGGSVLDNQDRDRDEFAASLRLGYQFQTDKQAFVTFRYNESDYRLGSDRNGLTRDSSGWTTNAGLLFNITGKLDGDVFVTYLDRSVDDPGLPDVNGWAGGAGLQWRPTLLTSVGLRLAGTVQPTTYRYSSGYLERLYSLRIDHELLRRLQVSGMVSYRDNDYQLTADAPVGARSSDKVWQYGLGLSYFINRWMFLSASYTRDTLDSSVPLDDYDVNRFWVTLSLER